MLNYIRNYFSDDLAIDIGTTNTLIYLKNKGIILDEPSVAAINQQKGTNAYDTIKSAGKAAKNISNTTGNIQLIKPVQNGIIIDFIAIEQVLKYFIKKASENKLFKLKPRIIVCVPCFSNQIYRKSLRQATLKAGARQVFLIEQPMAAAIGASLPVERASSSMIVDIGAGTTEIGIISLGGMIYKGGIEVGGNKFDEAIIN